MLNILNETKRLIICPVVLATMMITGCTAEEEKKSEPAVETVDLATAQDLFAQPIKQNPLISDPEAVVITVNGTEIKNKEIEKIMDQAMSRLMGQVPPENLAQMKERIKQDIVNQLVTKTLIDQAKEQASIEVTAEEVADAIEKIKSNVPEGMTFEQALVKNNTSLDELTKNIEDQLSTEKFLDEKVKNIVEVSEEKAKEFYDSNQDKFTEPEMVEASHILIGTEEGDTDEVKAEKKVKLEKIRADIISGTNTFEAAAKEFSSCPSAEKGGNLGSFRKGQMAPPFELAAFSQEVNEVGDIVETKFGYHIIKVTKHTEPKTVSFEEAKERIVSYLTNQEKQTVITKYIESLKSSATIEPPLKAE